MAEPVTAAKTIITLAGQLFKKDQNGEAVVKKVAIGVGIGLLGIALFMEACTVILNIPMNTLTEFLLPDSVVEARRWMDEAFSRPVISTGEEGYLALPVTSQRTSSRFGYRVLNGSGNWHEGLDFPVGMKSPVMSTAPGTVVAAGVDTMYGQYIKIRHEVALPDEEELKEHDAKAPDTYGDVEVYYTFYAHLYHVYVFVGDVVDAQEQIALSGGDNSHHFAGNSTGAHLHFEIRLTPDYGSQVDPYDWLLRPLSEEEERWKELTKYSRKRDKGEYDY